MSVSFLPVAQHQLLNGISTCDYDAGISALAMTDVLREQMAFSEPYLTVGQVVVVKKGNITIQGRDQLGGATVGVERGSRGAEELQSIPNAQPKVYPTASAALQDLIAGYVDAVITNRPLAQTFASTPANNLKIAGQEFAAEDYGIALCSQKPELVEQINDGLAAVKRDGTLDKLKQKWFKTR